MDLDSNVNHDKKVSWLGNILDIARERNVPQGENGKVYTLKEYLGAMEKMTEEMHALLSV